MEIFECCVALSLSTLGHPVRRYIDYRCDFSWPVLRRGDALNMCVFFTFCPQLILRCGDELNMCDSLCAHLVLRCGDVLNMCDTFFLRCGDVLNMCDTFSLRCGDVLNICIYVTFPLFTVGPPVRRYIGDIWVLFSIYLQCRAMQFASPPPPRCLGILLVSLRRRLSDGTLSDN